MIQVNYEASQATNNDRHQSPTSPVSKYSQGFVSPPAATVEGNEAFGKLMLLCAIRLLLQLCTHVY